MSELIENPFGQLAAQPQNAVADSDAQRSIQEVQAAMVIAKKFPRNPIECMDRILNSCTRPTLAESAIYCYPKGGQEITGASIRLAEAIAQEWGNIQFGIRELSQDKGVSTVEAFAWDVERNTRQVKTFQVKHERHTRQGVKNLTDTRDVYELVANQGARRLRACILGVIPGDVVEKALEQCILTQRTNIDVSPDGIKKMLDTMAQFKVTKEMIEKRIGKHIEAIQPAQMQQLRNIYQSMKDGMSGASDWFEVPQVDDKTKSAIDDVQKQLEGAK